MSWLSDTTNRDEAYWMARVQTLIGEHTMDNPDDPNHGLTDDKWVNKLADEVKLTMPAEGNYDGNMRMAATLGAILCLWYGQTHFAKVYDSHRPVFERQQAYRGRLKWAQDIFHNLIDSSQGPTFFPGQPWQFPFDPNAKGGDFL